MESWMISVAIGALTYFSMLVTMKNKTDQHSLDIKEIKGKGERHKKEDDILHGRMFDKLDEVNKELATHKVFIGNAPTMEQVRNEFVTKEMFKQMEKHIDEKFDKLENGIDKILDKLEKRG